MNDIICKLADELCNHHNLHVLDKHVKKILKNLNIIEKIKFVKTNYSRRTKEECYFYAVVDEDHNQFNEMLNIIIKPDHAEKRILRIVVQVGSKIYERYENKDKGKWSSEKVFWKAEKKIEKDLKEMLNAA